MIELLKSNKEQIEELCTKNKVKHLFVFGSILTDRFNASSDIDFLVEFNDLDTLDYLDYYYNLKFGLEEVLNRSIDLLEIQAIQNPLMKLRLDNTKQMIYATRNKDMAA